MFQTRDLTVRITLPRSLHSDVSHRQVRRVFLFRNTYLQESRGQDLYDTWVYATQYLAPDLAVPHLTEAAFHVVKELKPAPDGHWPPKNMSDPFGCGSAEPYAYMLFHPGDMGPLNLIDDASWFFYSDSLGGHGLIVAVLTTPQPQGS